MKNNDAILTTIIKNGLTTYKTKNSKAILPARVQAEKKDKVSRKGSIFVVRSKDNFTVGGVKGYVITSMETLLEDASSLTHFTPNVYRVAMYKDEERRYIKGFGEENLQQINTFVIDIDTKQHSVQDILLTCLDSSIGAPTLIVESERGYQVYFVLEDPLFISNKNDFRGLKVAKRISDNLKRSLKNVEADLYCNDFGFFRLPTSNNVVWAHLDNTYTMSQFINWSRRRDDGERPLFAVPSIFKPTSVLNSDWFHALISATDIKGEKGQMGRNNALFTLALICYSEGWEQKKTFDFLDEYNSRLRYPLSGADLKSVLNSAYSGKYQGASKEYIEGLLELYVKNGMALTVTYGAHGWYKFKKERVDRVRSHYSEWEQDIIDFITVQKSEDEPFIWCTQKTICEAINIPSSTLNVVLKQSTKLFIVKRGKGRGAKTGWTTVSLLLQYVIKLAQELQKQKEEYRLQLHRIVVTTLKDLNVALGYESFVNVVNALEHGNTQRNMLFEMLGGSG